MTYIFTWQIVKLSSISVMKLSELFEFVRRTQNRLLPPANEVCEGYVFTRVCQSFCSQGGRAWPGGACVAGACVARGACMPGGACAVCTPRGLIIRDTFGQCAGGTHPTGMHSCLSFISHFITLDLKPCCWHKKIKYFEITLKGTTSSFIFIGMVSECIPFLVLISMTL